MKKSIISAKIFPRRGAERAEKGKGLNFRILSASSAPLRELFSWRGFGCGLPRCEIRGSIPFAAHLLYRCRNPKIKANQG